MTCKSRELEVYVLGGEKGEPKQQQVSGQRALLVHHPAEVKNHGFTLFKKKIKIKRWGCCKIHNNS